MRKNINSLYGTTMMTAAERSMGRFMRAPDGHDGGATGTGDSTSGGNNIPPVNNDSGSSATSQNNSGDTNDGLASFWSEPSPEGNGSASNGGSAAPANQGDGSQPKSEGDSSVSAFAKALSEVKFGDVFTNEAIQAMNENSDPALFNQNLQKFGSEAVRQSVLMSARLMQQLSTQMEERFDALIQEKLGQRDADTDLTTAIPSAKDPRVKPLVDRIFAQAQKHHPKDRNKAIQVTKDMLRLQMETMGADVGLDRAPNGPDDQLVSATNWEKELLGIGS